MIILLANKQTSEYTRSFVLCYEDAENAIDHQTVLKQDGYRVSLGKAQFFDHIDADNLLEIIEDTAEADH